MAANCHSAIYLAACVIALWTVIPKANAIQQTESYDGDITDIVVTEPTNAYDASPTVAQEIETLKSLIGNLQSQLSQTQGNVAGK